MFSFDSLGHINVVVPDLEKGSAFSTPSTATASSASSRKVMPTLAPDEGRPRTPPRPAGSTTRPSGKSTPRSMKAPIPDAPMRITRAVLAEMVKACRGSIINIGSSWSTRASVFNQDGGGVDYCSSKAALHALTRATAQDVDRAPVS